MDDSQIVALYWQRDEQAIVETDAKYGSYCMKISQNILSDRADSEENVNDAYLHAWEAMPPQRQPCPRSRPTISAPRTLVLSAHLL